MAWISHSLLLGSLHVHASLWWRSYGWWLGCSSWIWKTEVQISANNLSEQRWTVLFSTIFEGYATAACQSAVLWGTWGVWYLQPNTLSKADALAWAGLMSQLECVCKGSTECLFSLCNAGYQDGLGSSLGRNTATDPQKTAKDPYQPGKGDVNVSWSEQGRSITPHLKNHLTALFVITVLSYILSARGRTESPKAVLLTLPDMSGSIQFQSQSICTVLQTALMSSCPSCWVFISLAFFFSSSESSLMGSLLIDSLGWGLTIQIGV